MSAINNVNFRTRVGTIIDFNATWRLIRGSHNKQLFGRVRERIICQSCQLYYVGWFFLWISFRWRGSKVAEGEDGHRNMNADICGESFKSTPGSTDIRTHFTDVNWRKNKPGGKRAPGTRSQREEKQRRQQGTCRCRMSRRTLVRERERERKKG